MNKSRQASAALLPFHVVSGKLIPMELSQIITLEPGKRSSQPCIRGMRITVYDILSYLASGMTHEEILADFPYLTKADITPHLTPESTKLDAHTLIKSSDTFLGLFQ